MLRQLVKFESDIILTSNQLFDPANSNSDIWRNYPNFMKAIFRRIYLSPQQGSSTSVAASILDFDDNQDIQYLQPYWIPSSSKRPPYPMFEMLGPYVGYKVTTPRLPTHDMGEKASESLFTVCEELTNCKYPESIGE